MRKVVSKFKSFGKLVIKPFKNKNRLLSLGVSLGYLILLFSLDSLLVHLAHEQVISASVAGWWSIVRVFLMIWAVILYAFLRTFDKSGIEKKSKEK